MDPSAPYLPAPPNPALASSSFLLPFTQQSSPRSLHIATGAAGAHAPEPEEQTAHPLRPHGHDADADVADYAATGSIADAMTHGPGPHGGLTRALTHKERELIGHLDRLKYFLATAPSRWSTDDPHAAAAAAAGLSMGHPSSTHPALNRFLLPNSEYVSCVLWGGLYHITGTDIVRALVFRFEAFGRPVRNMKKFEEGVFSDLRNLKPGMDACLEEPKVSTVPLRMCAHTRIDMIACHLHRHLRIYVHLPLLHIVSDPIFAWTDSRTHCVDGSPFGSDAVTPVTPRMSWWSCNRASV